MTQRWHLNQFDWTAVAPARVPPELLQTVKTAALVEANSADYVTYLRNVFAQDAEFVAAAELWGEEEAQHGAALARWAQAVDPAFDFEAALARFRAGYQLPLASSESVRGSRTGELVARCIVESGTCSFYSAMRDYSPDPVLRAICHCIAQDEAGHYQLFAQHMRRYLQKEPISFLGRLKVALGRVEETDDDELAYAYYSANVPPGGEAYERKRCADAYWRRAMTLYRPQHLLGAARMIVNAAGLRVGPRLLKLILSGVWWGVQRRLRSLRALSA